MGRKQKQQTQQQEKTDLRQLTFVFNVDVSRVMTESRPKHRRKASSRRPSRRG